MSFCTPSHLSKALNIKNLVCHANDFDVSAYSDSLFRQYKIEWVEKLTNATPKRKAEYLCGRHTASQSLQALGIQSCNIATGPNREPVFPAGIIASITHTNETAVCVAAKKNHFHYLGVDLESLIPEDTIQSIEQQIINHDEKRLLLDQNCDYKTLLTLVFSAKESLFKALFPSVGDYFDFQAAQLVKLCAVSKRITFELTGNLNSEFPAKTKISGSFYLDKRRVFTVIYSNKI